MYDIQLNESGSRHLWVTDAHMATLRKYNLLDGLVGSTGFVTEEEVNKLRRRVEALTLSQGDEAKDLLKLSADVVFADKLKAFGLKHLLEAFRQYCATTPAESEEA